MSGSTRLLFFMASFTPIHLPLVPSSQHMATLPNPLKLLSYLWASPYTLFACGVGLIGLCTGGKVRTLDGILEFHGGFTQWFVRHLPLGEDTIAITLGHCVLGQTEAGLSFAHEHEMVHVRQFERWGPLMGPAYLLCWFVIRLRGGNGYWDNPFEREAYGKVEESR